MNRIMKRIPGMPIESQAAFRRHLIGQALAGVCANPEAHCNSARDPAWNDRDIARAAIAIANEVINLLSEWETDESGASKPLENKP